MIQKKNNYLKSIIHFLIQAGVMVALLVGVSIFHRGMYLIGVPKAEKVQYVTVSYPEVTDEEKKITDREQIRLAVQLTGFLRYSLLEEADSGESPMITITYYQENQPAITVSANRNTVWWKGKSHVIKDPDMFVNLTEGIFFLEDLPEGRTERN